MKNSGKVIGLGIGFIVIFLVMILVIKFFSEESQNKFTRSLNTVMGMKTGCVEIYVGQKEPVKRFLRVEKFSTAFGTDDNKARPYRYGFGYNDKNLNNKIDVNEKKSGKVYFEVSEYSQYLYYEEK